MNKGRGGVRAVCRLWLAAGVVACTATAAPIVPDSGAHDTLVREATVSDENLFPDRRFAAIREATREIRQNAPGISTALGLDDGFLQSANLLNSELRETAWTSPWNAPQRASPQATGGPDIFRDTMDTALRAARDALFDGGDTANLSLAGIELSVTMRGDRRAFSINGYDVVASNQYAPVSDATRPAAMPRAVTVTEVAIGGADGKLTLEDIHRFLLDPLTIAGMLVLLGVWMVLAMASARARGN